MSKNNQDKDSYQEEVNALKAELKRLKAKEQTLYRKFLCIPNC